METSKIIGVPLVSYFENGEKVDGGEFIENI